MKAKGPSEAQIQKSILQYLAAKKILAWRMNTGAVKTDNRFIRFGTPGMADILASTPYFDDWGVLKGQFLWIECKTDTGKQTLEQISFQNQVEAAGHKYIVARSIEDVEPWL